MNKAGILLIALAVIATASADTLRLTNGAKLEGTFLGADTRQVRFMGADGAPKTYSISSIAGIGAAVGAGLGAISGAAAKGKSLMVPPETRLTFQLRAPLPLG